MMDSDRRKGELCRSDAAVAPGSHYHGAYGGRVGGWACPPPIRSGIKRWKINRFNSTLMKLASSDAQTAVTSTKFQLQRGAQQWHGNLTSFKTAAVLGAFVCFTFAQQQFPRQQAQEILLGQTHPAPPWRHC